MVLKGPSWLWLTSGLSQSLQGWIISRSTISSWFFFPSKCLKPQIRSIFYVPKGGKWIVVVDSQSYCSFWEDGRALTYTLALRFICCGFANQVPAPFSLPVCPAFSKALASEFKWEGGASFVRWQDANIPLPSVVLWVMPSHLVATCSRAKRY